MDIGNTAIRNCPFTGGRHRGYFEPVAGDEDYSTLRGSLPIRPEYHLGTIHQTPDPSSADWEVVHDLGFGVALQLREIAVSTATSTDTAIRPFRVDIPQDELDDLKRRILATRWPTKETVDDASQGVQLATMQALAHYWVTEHDWRKVEARLNVVPAVPHRDRRARHPLHPRPLAARECVADDRHPWLAGLDHRATEDHRSADRPDRARRHARPTRSISSSRRCRATASRASRR